MPRLDAVANEREVDTSEVLAVKTDVANELDVNIKEVHGWKDGDEELW